MSIVLKNSPKTQGYYSIPDLPDFRLGVTLPITADVSYKQGDSLIKIFSGSYIPGIDLEVSVCFREILKSLLISEEPKFDLSYFPQHDFFKEIHIVFKDEDGELESVFYITNVNATLQNDANIVLGKRFLTLQPDVKETTDEAPEFLTYYYSGNAGELVAQFYSDDDNVETVTLYVWDCIPRALTHKVHYKDILSVSGVSSSVKKPFFDIFVVDEVGKRISLKQRYIIRQSKKRDKYYLFYNSLGGLDTLVLDGTLIETPKTTFDIARTSSGLLSFEGRDVHISYEQCSGYCSKDLIRCIQDFVMLKNKKYVFEDGVCSEIIITEADLSFDDKENFFSFSFSYRKNDPSLGIADLNIENQELITDNIPEFTLGNGFDSWNNAYVWDNNATWNETK